MDLTVEVMLPPRGAVDFLSVANPVYRVLAPVAVYTLKTVAVVGMPCTGYVHVLGVPSRPAWANLDIEEILRRINARLCKQWFNADGTATKAPTTHERRIWGGLSGSIPAGARNTLLTERQLTITWTQFKNFLQHLAELRALTDTDLD